MSNFLGVCQEVSFLRLITFFFRGAALSNVVHIEALALSIISANCVGVKFGYLFCYIGGAAAEFKTKITCHDAFRVPAIVVLLLTAVLRTS